jgi:HD-GYP domain-containing protein (c-di-GMP phosphodiesterase class II)
MPSLEKRRKIDTNKLQVGMYVIMPLSWKEHPFLVNRFLISSPSQIDKMRKAGLKSVMVDFDRSRLAPDSPEYRPEQTEPQRDSTSNPDTDDTKTEMNSPPVVIESIKEAVSNQTLSPEEKVKMVYRQSIEMIRGVLEQPTTKNIGAAKRAIVGIVDMILAEEQTSRFLLQIISHDFYTYTHSVNVGFFSVCLAKKVFQKSEAHDMHELGVGFFLHDLGKVGIPSEIINKPGRLTDAEMDVVCRHPSHGFRILEEAGQLTEECTTIVLQHHERVNGTGYPKRLCGEEIHIYGRICSIADVYDALTSNRPYRQKMHTYNALRLMKDEMIGHFQKELFDNFVMLFA